MRISSSVNCVSSVGEREAPESVGDNDAYVGEKEASVGEMEVCAGASDIDGAGEREGAWKEHSPTSSTSP